MSPHSCSTISADGSDRKFRRILFHGRTAVRIIPPDTEVGIREAHSFFHIGSHLFEAGLPVPEIYEFDQRTGTLTVEDLGDTLLYDAALPLRQDNRMPELVLLYQDAVSLLCDFQRLGTRHFDTRWCFDTPEYNSAFAWEREALYFLDSFLSKQCGMIPAESLIIELKRLCSLLDGQQAGFSLMHRDFQCRNIMVHKGKLRIIDFQGARSGPWGYDLASLVYDPYMDIPEDMRQELVEFYFDKRRGEKSTRETKAEFYVVALLRTLQALGAYAFLGIEKKKPFFTPFIKPALRNLHVLVHRECFSWLSELRLTVDLLLNSDR